MKQSIQLQQGDVTITSIAKLPTGANPINDPVIAHGEGHHEHRLSTLEGVEMYEKDGVRFARISQPISLDHTGVGGNGPGEHRSVALDPGIYQFGQVQEFDYLSEMARAVVD